MVYIKYLFLMLMLLFVGLQFNDYDPFLWVLMYGLVAFVTALSLIKIESKIIYNVLMILLLLFLGVQLFVFKWVPNESMNEIGGTLLCILWVWGLNFHLNYTFKRDLA